MSTSRFGVVPPAIQGAVPIRTTDDAAGFASAGHVMMLETAGVAAPVSVNSPLPAQTSPVGVALTNYSGTIQAGGASQLLMAANGARKMILVVNPAGAAEPLLIEFGPSATLTSFPVPPGGSFSWPPGTIYTGPIAVLGATTGHAFCCVEGH